MKELTVKEKLAPFMGSILINPSSGCWLWMAATTPKGYGQVWAHKKMRRAHRVIYEIVKGDIPENLQLHHECCVKNCVNPDHLELVTNKENCQRIGIRKNNFNSRKTRCPQGHEYSSRNTYIHSGARHCRKCMWLRDNGLLSK